MSVHTAELVTVWLAAGVPARLLWRGTRYRVTDTPTRLEPPDDLSSRAMTHPPAAPGGWRFQATSASGETHVFDVKGGRGSRGAWHLVAVYD